MMWISAPAPIIKMKSKLKIYFSTKIEILAFDDKLVVDSGNNRAKDLETE